MELFAERDPEEARNILDPVLERMMEAVHHYEGHPFNPHPGTLLMDMAAGLIDGIDGGYYL